TISDRNGQLSNLIVQLRSLMQGLVEDRHALLGPLDDISVLAQQTAALTKGIRPSLRKDVAGLRKVAKNLDKGRSAIDSALQVLPIKLDKIGRTAIYGSYFNFYLCQFQGQIALGGQPLVNLPRLDVGKGIASNRCDLS